MAYKKEPTPKDYIKSFRKEFLQAVGDENYPLAENIGKYFPESEQAIIAEKTIMLFAKSRRHKIEGNHGEGKPYRTGRDTYRIRTGGKRVEQ